MTVYTLTAPMPPVSMTQLMLLKLEAIDPSTGAAITGVTCSHWSIYGERLDTADAGQAAAAGPFMLVPGPDGTG